MTEYYEVRFEKNIGPVRIGLNHRGNPIIKPVVTARFAHLPANCLGSIVTDAIENNENIFCRPIPEAEYNQPCQLPCAYTIGAGLNTLL
jgi:hypothetical protein